MKELSTSIFIVMFFFSGLLQAQNNLADSKRESERSYIYTINKDCLREIHLKDKSINEDMLGQYVAEFATWDKKIPDLPAGNYIIVKSTSNQLNFTDHIVDDLYFKIVPSEEMMLCLYDSLGNIIKDAVVKYGSKALKYNKTTQTYNTPSIKDGDMLEVNNRGVYHYIEIEKQHYRYYASKKNIFNAIWGKMKRGWYNLKEGVNYIFHPEDRPTKYKYTGFVVFNKPKYKPGETVKLKAYVSEYDGKPYNKSVDVRLYGGYYPLNVDTVLTNLSPYRPGMYEYQFQLTDSLDLNLDTNYTIAFKTSNKRYNAVLGNFRYEEYELKGINFSMRTDKEEYVNQDSVKINFKVTDENDLAVYDGKIDIQVTSASLNTNKMNGSFSVFLPDTVWTHTLDMNGKSEHEVILPDSIFPPGISFYYQVRADYLSADNEKQTQSKRLYRKADDYIIDFSLDKGLLTIKELHKEESHPVMALLEICGENGEVLSTDSAMLPYTKPLPWFVTDVTVRTEHTTDYYFLEEATSYQLGYRFYRQNDSIYLKVDNPAGTPFWYILRKNKKEIVKGYATTLDYSLDDKDEAGYAMQLSYIFGENTKYIEEQLPFIRKNMSIEVSTPSVVYPGQTTDVVVDVTDKEGKPVDNVDITAYSFTSKFKNYNMPDVPIRGKAKYASLFDRTLYESNENDIISKGKMTWENWKHTMSLDTIEYYKFLYPDKYYHYTEPTTDGSTLISPYIVIDGALQGVNMLWIDGRLYYTSLAQQYNNYVFPVEPGKHLLRFRTYDREISVHYVILQKGTRNILSFNAGKPYISASSDNEENLPLVITSRELKKKNVGKITNQETHSLMNQLITVDNNFGWIWLPNLNNPLDVAASIRSGHTLYYLNPSPRRKYDYRINGYVNHPVLVGPFPSRNYSNGFSDMASVYAENKLITHIGIEGGNHYTLYPGYQKIKNWSEWSIKLFNRYTPEVNFQQQPLTKNFIQQHFRKRVLDQLSASTGFAEIRHRLDNLPGVKCRLNLSVGKDVAGKDIKPVLVFIVPENAKDIGNYQLCYGATRHFAQLPKGDMRVSLIINDSVSYSQSICLQPYGENYLALDSIAYDNDIEIAQTAFRIFNRNIKREFTRNPYLHTPAKDSIVSIPIWQEEVFFNDAPGSIIKGTVRDSSGEPLIGVSVTVKGTSMGTITDLDGNFELSAAANGNELVISYIGYQTKTVRGRQGYQYNITLREDFQELDEVVVVGYGTQKRRDLTGSLAGVHVGGELEDRMTRVTVRGTSSFDNSNPPLILVNGLPYDGSLDSIDQASIKSVNVLKDATATAIYGARAANGVIMIETNALNTSKAGSKEEELPVIEPANTMRRNFHDDAFWQPRLRTNEKGKATFQVTYPDDITSWNAYFIAIGNKKQSDKKQMTIRSFKALTARLSTPRFAIRGDSLNAVGRISNHYGDSVSVTRKIETDQVQQDDLEVSTSHVDYIPVKVDKSDSLTLAYSLQMANGYFDGEQRSFPVLEQGMLQTYGEFKVINDSATHLFTVKPDMGTITIHAETSSLDLFLREIEKVDRYPYMCNEQVASKIKVLLSKKRIAKLFEMEFKEDGKINNLINHLAKNRNAQGLWGWWNVGNTEVWISRHVVSALLDAQEAGYDIRMDIPNLSYSMEQELKSTLASLTSAVPGKASQAKEELLERLINLKRMNAPIDYQSYFRGIDKRLENNTLTDKLKTMHAMAVIGLKDEINRDSLMHYAKKTMLGSLYWGDQKEVNPLYRSFRRPYGTNIDNTLIAYNILREIGGYEDELMKVRNYFFENRHGSFWQNTYQSSRIIETIMPDMLKDGQAYAETIMIVNGKKVTKFPYTSQLDSQSALQIKKQGTAPLFTTVYQQNWNRKPEPEVGKGFVVKSVFTESNDTVSYFTAGKVAKLEVSVTVNADAEYVQIEVPIPAGCSYDSKSRGNYWKEVHREHFKEKVVIFSNKLTEGVHLFTIELIPRFTGRYSLNPAKAELMYFPTFYGNESMKTVRIE